MSQKRQANVAILAAAHDNFMDELLNFESVGVRLGNACLGAAGLTLATKSYEISVVRCEIAQQISHSGHSGIHGNLAIP
jgi:hypothetical protein